MRHLYDTAQFEEKYTYAGGDLGAVWSPEATAFRVWSPTADAVSIRLYGSGDLWADDLLEEIPMVRDVNGTWIARKNGNLHGIYYTIRVSNLGRWTESCDPYARATGVNGHRAMVIDLASTDPEGWDADSDPHAGIAVTDAVIYELHIRDLSIDESSGITHKGKYLGVIEENTRNAAGCPTGLSHIKNLGITHLHILPMYDYGSVDESRPDVPQFNWGYDPVNFNVPEGSYSTDPWHGEVRVREVKQMVKGLHDNGISVVMDVVYNHVFHADAFCFNNIVPMYFSRMKEDGSLRNDSFCGNDTASERSMVRKYIVDSVKYWADEYHIDGFRFDLVGLIDTKTINAVMKEVHKTHPNVIFYGEGWDMYTGPLHDGLHMTVQANGHLVPGFAFFNDSIRDLLSGRTFGEPFPGFISCGEIDRSVLVNCFNGAPEWAVSPRQSVNYVSCHDNNTLIDRITLFTPGVSPADRIRMNNLAAAYYLTAQGIPFMQAGEEMLRSKPTGRGKFEENSYRSADSVNSIKWNNLSKPRYLKVMNYYKGLIALRKLRPCLREAPSDGHVRLHTGKRESLAFLVNDTICLIFNADWEPLNFWLPQGKWDIYVNENRAGTRVLGHAEGMVTVPRISAMVLIRNEKRHRK